MNLHSHSRKWLSSPSQVSHPTPTPTLSWWPHLPSLRRQKVPEGSSSSSHDHLQTPPHQHLGSPSPCLKGGRILPPVTDRAPHVALWTRNPSLLHKDFTLLARPFSSESLNFPFYWIIWLAKLLQSPSTPFSFSLRVSIFCRVSLTDFSKWPFARTVSTCSEFSPPIHLPSHLHFLLTPRALTSSKFSNVITFPSSVSLEPLSLLCSHDIALIPGFPSNVLVASWQAHLQMLCFAWSPHLEPLHSHSSHLPHMTSLLPPLSLNFTSQWNLPILHNPRLFSTIEVCLLPALPLYCLLNYSLLQEGINHTCFIHPGMP